MKSGRYLHSVRRGLSDEAQALLEQAFGGDALAARRLMVMAPRRMRGHIAYLAYQSKVPNPAYREIMRAVWAKDARSLLTEFWRPQVVRRMLAQAEFRVPAFSGPVTVFRALTRAPAREAAAALSWSLSREAALSEAAQKGDAKPGLLQATIEPSDIIYWRNAHGEQEVVGRRPVTGAVKVEQDPPRRGGQRSAPELQLANSSAAASY